MCCSVQRSVLQVRDVLSCPVSSLSHPFERMGHVVFPALRPGHGLLVRVPLDASLSLPNLLTDPAQVCSCAVRFVRLVLRYYGWAPTSQPRSSLHSILRSSQRAADLHLVPQEVGISQFRYLKLPHMQRVFDHAARPQLLPYRAAGCCLPLRLTASAARDCVFRGSIPRLRLPLSTESLVAACRTSP